MKLPWKHERITFERFMEFCLYDPEWGYYTTRYRIFGRDGDYYTSSHTHSIFAHCLGEAFVHYFNELNGPEPFDLVELGAGEGLLGEELLRWWKEEHPEIRIRYLPVEVGNHLPDAIHGVVFSNEFFDALPVHRVRAGDSRLQEVLVQINDGISEVEGEVSDPRILEYMRAGFPVWRKGWEYEVNLRMVEVLEDLDQRVQSGIHLVIDYGYDWGEYDVLERPGGTLMCYHRHQVNADPYRHLGRQDITAHVNFDVMRKTAEKLGWKNEPLRTQREFLQQWGLDRRLRAEEKEGLFRSERLKNRLRLKDLLIPGGICDTLKVLVQRIRC